MSEEQKTETPEELAEWAKRKKQQQHDAYRRWYLSPKGQEYAAKRRAKLKLMRMEKAGSEG